MGNKKFVFDAINSAYKAQIKSMYDGFSNSILTANGNDAEIKKAEEKFKAGMDHAYKIRMQALALAGIQE